MAASVDSLCRDSISFSCGVFADARYAQHNRIIDQLIAKNTNCQEDSGKISK
jgi:hypothetical protein